MRSVVLSVAISLDGYVARPDGSVDFLVMDPEIDFAALFGRFDVTILGRKTYGESMKQGGGATPGIAGYVFSRSLPPGKRDGVEFVSGPPAELVAELKGRSGKDIWLMGGGELTREFLKADLIDEIELTVMPTLLGAGIPLFPGGFEERKFRFGGHKLYPSTGIVGLTYLRAR